MTLILSCTTSDFAFQVSDRRLTALDGAQPGILIDDEANKAVVVHGRLAFGYTGLAKIGPTPTDVWLTNTAAAASSNDLRSVCEHIRHEATRAFSASQIAPRFRRHAFIGIGWAGRVESPGLHPTLCTISNAIGADGEWLETAASEFSLLINNWGRIGSGFGIAASGQTLKPAEKYAIWRLVRRCIKADAGPEAIFRVLIMALEYAANRYPIVGGSLMAVCMPRVAAERQLRTGSTMFLAGAPMREQNTFLYLRPGGSAIGYGPHIATRGFAMSNFNYGPAESQPRPNERCS